MIIYCEYKGRIIKKYFKIGDNNLTKIYILITDKGKLYNPNYHFICDIKTGRISIPNTSLIPKETAYVCINLKKNTNIKTFKIPIHSIYSLGQDLPTTFKIVVDINV